MRGSDEARRIVAEYSRREQVIDPGYYSLTRSANLFFHQRKTRHLIQILRQERLLPLRDRKILDVGCGGGLQLIQFETFGAQRRNLAGIDLVKSRVNRARLRLSGSTQMHEADIRFGDASNLPWPDSSFEIIYQGTAISSILDPWVRQSVTSEMLRVLAPGGLIISYDFFVKHPSNPHVTGIGWRELQRLFPGCIVKCRRITLAPPLARVVVPLSWILAELLEEIRIFNTHYLASIRRCSSEGGSVSNDSEIGGR